MASVAARFWVKVDRSGECWQWTGALLRNGYGYFNNGHRNVVAHRWAYEAVRGPIPEGLVIDHLCRVRSCVNPGHLEAVPQSVNVMRGIGVGRPRKDVCRKGHPLVAGNVDVRPDGGRRCSTCRRSRENAYKAGRRRLVGA